MQRENHLVQKGAFLSFCNWGGVRGEVQQSVTSLVFQDEHNLYTCGAADGAVKLWDMRRYYTSVKGSPQPKHVYPYVGTSTRRSGMTSLSSTSCGRYLFSNCTDDLIYMYNTQLCDQRDPVAVFSGHTNNTFFVRSTVSMCDRFLVSGSSSNSIFVWDIAHPDLAPVQLDGHMGR
eukprot:sb/3471962/